MKYLRCSLFLFAALFAVSLLAGSAFAQSTCYHCLKTCGVNHDEYCCTGQNSPCPHGLCGGCYCTECNTVNCDVPMNDGFSCYNGVCPADIAAKMKADDTTVRYTEAWMEDANLSAAISEHSKSMGAFVLRLQQNLHDATMHRRRFFGGWTTSNHVGMVFPGRPSADNELIGAVTYYAKTKKWEIRLLQRFMDDDPEGADFLQITPTDWFLHQEVSWKHVGEGKIAPLAEPVRIDDPLVSDQQLR